MKMYKNVGYKRCIACDKCGCGDNRCVFRDDMIELWPELENADIVVFASPLYYYSATAQLLSVVARFYAIDKHLKGCITIII